MGFLYSHIHVINAQLAMEMFPNITAKPHGLRGEKSSHFFIHADTLTSILCLQWHTFAYLSLLDGLSRSLFEQLDGLVVVQRVAAPNHVTKELDAIQLTVGVLGSRIIYEADLGIESCRMCSAGTGELPTGRQNLKGVHRTG